MANSDKMPKDIKDMAIIIKKKRVRKGLAVIKDPKKEAVFKGLSSVLGRSGFLVRREELKRGPGWKATSGFCRHNDSKTIFVDRLLPQDEQISFLVEQIQELSIKAIDSELQIFPEVIQRQLSES
ncbi:MAG: hypothetical protein SGJ02_00530 [bacterium]|nr:hypothetical protein [bacterium]